MKKILILFSCLFFISPITFSAEKYILNENEIEAVNKVYEIYSEKILDKGEEYKNTLISSLELTLQKFEFEGRNYEIINALIAKMKDETTLTNNDIVNETDTNTQEEDTDTSNEDNMEQDKLPGIENDFRVNFDKVRETWVGRQNEVRADLDLVNYNYNKTLENTAQEWSEIMANKQETDHLRDAGDPYYDYNKIATWMKDRGVVCVNKYRATFSESVSWTSYYCPEDATDCTYEFIDGLRNSFDRYMSERERSEESRPHYNAIVSTMFRYQGMGIAIREKSPTHFEVYITTHYCTELEE